jgi:RND family efflux transporter MFP subunit
LSALTKLVIQVVSFLLLVAGIGLITYARRTESIERSPRALPAGPDPMSFQAPLTKRLAQEGFVGVVVAGQAVDIAPKMSGRLQALHVKVGERLAANALIATLDTALIRQELKMGEAKLRVARAEEEKASAEFAQARDNLATLNGLQSAGHISTKELSGAQYQEKVAAAALEAARAHVAEAQANVAQRRESLAQAYVRAPYAGTVSERYLDPGSMVTPSTSIIRLISADDLRVRFAVREELAGTVALGMAVNVEVIALNAILNGAIENIAPEVDIASRHLLAEAKLEPLPEGFKRTIPSGLEARVSVIAPVHTGAH